LLTPAIAIDSSGQVQQMRVDQEHTGQEQVAHEQVQHHQPVSAHHSRSRRARPFGRLFVVLAIAIGATVAAAPAASAYPSWYQPNGCTAPGFLSSWNTKFRTACNRHDICYDWELNWLGEPGRLTCDIRFLNAMNATCGWDFGCRTMAGVYYSSVRTFGWPFFNNPWLN
jgi:hypothetical protein